MNHDIMPQLQWMQKIMNGNMVPMSSLPCGHHKEWIPMGSRG